MAGAVAAVAVPVLLITKVLGDMEKNAQAAAEAEQARVELTNFQISTENEYQRLVQQGDVEGILQRREDAWQGLADNTEQISTATGRLDELRKQEEALQQARDIAASSLDVRGLVVFQNELGKVQAQIKAQEENVTSLGETQAVLVTTTTEADEALSNFSDAQIAAAENADALRQVETSLTALEQQRTQVLTQLEQAENRATQVQQQRTAFIEQQAQQELFASQKAALESQFAQEDELA
jgi:hypothetical protein